MKSCLFPHPQPFFFGGGTMFQKLALLLFSVACCLFNYKVTKSNKRRVLWNIVHNHQSSTLPTCPAGIACVQHTCSLHHVISMVHSHGTALYGWDLEDKVTLPWFQHVHIFNIHEWFTYLNLQQIPKQCQV